LGGRASRQVRVSGIDVDGARAGGRRGRSAGGRRGRREGRSKAYALRGCGSRRGRRPRTTCSSPSCRARTPRR